MSHGGQPDKNVLVGLLFYGSVVLVNSSLSGICLLKGKYVLGGITAFIGGPFVNGVAACRLAKPGSWWARRFYAPHKLARARERSASRAALIGSLPWSRLRRADR